MKRSAGVVVVAAGLAVILAAAPAMARRGGRQYGCDDCPRVERQCDGQGPASGAQVPCDGPCVERPRRGPCAGQALGNDRAGERPDRRGDRTRDRERRRDGSCGECPQRPR